MLVKRMLGTVMALACVALLSSCSLIPPGETGDEGQQANTQMQHIADAVNNHDAIALEKLFSLRAREKATDLNAGLKYFLSVFPSGVKNWKILDGAPATSADNEDGYTEEELAFYKVSANGKEYDLFFANLISNTHDPKNVGLYALAVEPYTSNPYTPSGAAKPFYVWANSHNIGDHNVVTGAPGVYVPQK